MAVTEPGSDVRCQCCNGTGAVTAAAAKAHADRLDNAVVLKQVGIDISREMMTLSLFILSKKCTLDVLKQRVEDLEKLTEKILRWRVDAEWRSG